MQDSSSFDFIDSNSAGSDSQYQERFLNKLIADGVITIAALLGPSRGDMVINYKTLEGIKTYKRATTALKDEYNGK